MSAWHAPPARMERGLTWAACKSVELYRHTVPGIMKTSRVISLICETPYAVYANVALFPSKNVNVAEPTGVSVTFAGLNGTALNAGPLVRSSVPE